ncbi:acyltransferase [Pseudomonas sp. SWRI92]|uniref:acyltransferase family protein n=1 Tax=Pseudomonas sp. SWRI92 TaxID=2745499 RepID=UPI001647D761|nr:acyltransferase family protein [Pseudomonas sp. SWRI92]MBC3374668.1 acyltransferase [Pseudomonas sp. SWRI92]
MGAFTESINQEKHGTNNKNYRPDIDGLRALAILSVILFHAFPSAFPGGFIGVDIFFVISGYLISAIIIKGLKSDTFSFTDFYAHRINRIFPALLIVVVSVYLFGWVSLLPGEFKQLGLHTSAGTWFYENIVLWRESGYFDISSELKPLMHLWSLAVEEQFYLFFPLAMWIAWRLKLNLFFVIIIFSLTSFSANIFGIRSAPIHTFFMTHTRLWELLIGALLAYACINDYKINWIFKDRNLTNSFSIVGIGLITISAITISGKSEFPGWIALAPVFGTALLIAAGGDAWLNKNILSAKLMVYVGLISYPLYLWHWPILAYYRVLNPDSDSIFALWFCLAISILAAWLTYKFVEIPLRLHVSSMAKPVVLLAVIAVVGCAGILTYRVDGINGRTVVKINPVFENNPSGQSYMQKGCGLGEEESKKFPFCISDKRGDAEFAILGDSKAAAMTGGIFRYNSPQGYWVVLGGNGPDGAPAPIISDHKIYAKFQPLAKTALNRLASDNKIKVVVMIVATRNLFNLQTTYSIQDLPESRNYEVAREGLEGAVRLLEKTNKRVVIMVDNPALKDPKKCISRVTSLDSINSLMGLGQLPECSIPYDEHLAQSKKYRDLLDEIALKFPDTVKIFDGLDLLCDMKERLCKASSEGRLLYSYSDHVSNFASERIAMKLVPFVEKFAREASTAHR